MADKIKLYVVADFDMASMVKGRSLGQERVTLDMCLELTPNDQEMVRWCSAETLMGYFEQRLEPLAEQEFIKRIRTQPEMRRDVGGTRWKPLLKGDIIVALDELAARNFVHARLSRPVREHDRFTLTHQEEVFAELERQIAQHEKSAA